MMVKVGGSGASAGGVLGGITETASSGSSSTASGDIGWARWLARSSATSTRLVINFPRLKEAGRRDLDLGDGERRLRAVATIVSEFARFPLSVRDRLVVVVDEDEGEAGNAGVTSCPMPRDLASSDSDRCSTSASAAACLMSC